MPAMSYEMWLRNKQATQMIKVKLRGRILMRFMRHMNCAEKAVNSYYLTLDKRELLAYTMSVAWHIGFRIIFDREPYPGSIQAQIKALEQALMRFHPNEEN